MPPEFSKDKPVTDYNIISSAFMGWQNGERKIGFFAWHHTMNGCSWYRFSFNELKCLIL